MTESKNDLEILIEEMQSLFTKNDLEGKEVVGAIMKLVIAEAYHIMTIEKELDICLESTK